MIHKPKQLFLVLNLLILLVAFGHSLKPNQFASSLKTVQKREVSEDETVPELDQAEAASNAELEPAEAAASEDSPGADDVQSEANPQPDGESAIGSQDANSNKEEPEAASEEKSMSEVSENSENESPVEPAAETPVEIPVEASTETPVESGAENPAEESTAESPAVTPSNDTPNSEPRADEAVQKEEEPAAAEQNTPAPDEDNEDFEKPAEPESEPSDEKKEEPAAPEPEHNEHHESYQQHDEETTTTTTTTKTTTRQWERPATPMYLMPLPVIPNEETKITANCPGITCEFGYKTDLFGKVLCSCFNPCVEKKCGSDICKIEKVADGKFLGLCYDPRKIERPVKCHMPPAPGNCKNYASRFYYNSFHQRCIHFVFTGCNGNENNFPTWEKCHMECNTCSLPPVKGPCQANLIRYYYDHSRQTCVPFNYGGCKGNENNFNTKKQCEDSCVNRKEGALFLHGMPIKSIIKFYKDNKQTDTA